MNDKLIKALAIFKAVYPLASGKFQAIIKNSNTVEILSDGSLYCTISIKNNTAKLA